MKRSIALATVLAASILTSAHQSSIAVGFKKSGTYKHYPPELLRQVSRANLEFTERHWDQFGVSRQVSNGRSGNRMQVFRCCTGILCAWLIVGTLGSAQSIDPVSGKPGMMVAGIDQKIGAGPVDARIRQSAIALAEIVRGILLRDTALSHPMGYTVRVHRAFGSRTDWGHFDSGLPFFAGAYGTFFTTEDQKPSPTHFSQPEFGVYANTVLQCPMLEFAPEGNDHPWLVNGTLPVLQGGRRTGEIHGFTIYDGQCAVLGRSRQPPFLPLTHEQYLRLQINLFKDRLKNVPSLDSADPAMRQAVESGINELKAAIAGLEQEVAQMSATERTAPVAVRGGYAEMKLASIEDPEAVPLSIPNPAFFDHSLSPAAIQSVAVFLPFMQSGERAPGLPAGIGENWRPATEMIRDRLDWDALAALVHAAP